MAASRTRGERWGRIAVIGAGLLVTLFGINIARYNHESYAIVFSLLAIGAGVLMLYFALFRSNALSFASIVILVVTILITPYIGMLVFSAASYTFIPSIHLLFWYWIPVSSMMLFPVTVPVSIFGLMIVHFYIRKRTLPFEKPRWIIHMCILGSILGTLAVLPLLVSTAGFFISGGGDFHFRARLFLPTGLLTGCITGLLVALLTYKRVLLVMQEKKSMIPEHAESGKQNP
jgi:hypothetical protein